MSRINPAWCSPSLPKEIVAGSMTKARGLERVRVYCGLGRASACVVWDIDYALGGRTWRSFKKARVVPRWEVSMIQVLTIVPFRKMVQTLLNLRAEFSEY